MTSKIHQKLAIFDFRTVLSIDFILLITYFVIFFYVFLLQAKMHLLILPKEEINTLKDLNKGHLSLLKHIHDKAVEISSRYSQKFFIFLKITLLVH